MTAWHLRPINIHSSWINVGPLSHLLEEVEEEKGGKRGRKKYMYKSREKNMRKKK